MKLDGLNLKAYQRGRELSGQYDNESDACNSMSLSELENFLDFEYSQFFHAGFVGREPEYVTAIRYGKVPENGRSRNYSDGSYENGVSCVKIIRNESDADYKSIYDVTLGYQGIEKIVVEGWYLGQTGSDGEPLLVCAKEVKDGAIL
jgi:hypothetical protein